MAIKIIQSIERCSNCFTTVQFDSKYDVKMAYETNNGQTSFYHYINCPRCSHKIILK